jgi:hypothetical protein
VSITDHDTLGGCLEVRARHAAEVPISFEWTVPFDNGFFHLGVHNLEPDAAQEIFLDLTAFTAAPDGSKLTALLERLHVDPDTLVVLNHPMWDLAGVGPLQHLYLLTRFLGSYRPWIHATEVNGYRSWKENSCAMKIGTEYGLPVVSGGDRHGCAPNSLLNLTAASTFSEFVHEVRQGGVSTVLVMPEYRTSLVGRKLVVAADATRTYPGHPAGQQRWTERISYSDDHGSERPLSQNWPCGGPLWVRASIRGLQVGTTRPLLPFALALISLAGAATPDYASPSTYAETAADPVSVADSVDVAPSVDVR